MTALAAALAAAAAILLVGGRTSLLQERLGRPVRPAMRRERRPSPVARLGLLTVAGALAGAVVAGPVAAAGGALAAPVGRWWLSRRRARSVRSRREAEVADACLALAGELSAGVPPRHCLAVVAAEWPDLFGAAAGRSALGGDPVQALRETARQPGASPLTAVAAAWEVSDRTGAGLSSVLTSVADSLRAEAAVRREAGAQLAAVRATSRLMACLPVVTLLLFSGGDGDAVEFLTTSPYGVVCLMAAAGFIAAGLLWVDRVASSVRSAWEP
ncbi:type II secretion system F family protein [Jiangella asiatica]|uniref:type II secretion system F family protein n=1 Tax=Jiangella asiatica TaxID=2530372 RepID=UPI0013A5C387|nr:type II secretion system F family protein [Jiangella asiatica]